MKDFAKSIRTKNSNVGNYSKEELLKYAKMYGDKELIDYINSGRMTSSDLGARIRWFQYQWDGKDINGKIVDKTKAGNSKVGNEYKPDIRITPADLSRKLKQAKNISEIDDIDDEIEYDLREYENAIDECKLKIKDYERSMSALRMIQRDVSDARRNLK